MGSMKSRKVQNSSHVGSQELAPNVYGNPNTQQYEYYEYYDEEEEPNVMTTEKNKDMLHKAQVPTDS
jgi:hypothetical protein